MTYGWRENGSYWGTSSLFLGVKGGAALPHWLHIFIFFSYSSLEKRRAWWIILREEGGFLLNGLYIGLRPRLCNMCLICDHWHSMDNGRIPRFFSICIESMKMSDHSVWAFERNVGFIDRLLWGWVLSREKIYIYSSKELMYGILHSSFFMRG